MKGKGGKPAKNKAKPAVRWHLKGEIPIYINPHIENLYRVAWEQPRGEYLRLDMNENPSGLPEAFFRRVMSGISRADLSMYPEQGPLLDALAARLGVERRCLCLTNGSDDAIRLIFQTFGREGSGFLSVTPTFEMYPVYCAMYGLRHDTVPVGADFSLDEEAFLGAIGEDTSIVSLLNPNSPAGRPWTEAQVDRIIRKAALCGALVVIDEAYHYFYPSTFLHLIKKWDHLIVLRTFSKVFSMAGCRVGYAVAQPQTARALAKASSSYPLNAFGLAFAHALMEAPEVMEELICSEREGRAHLVALLKEAGYAHAAPGGNYVLIRPNTPPAELFARIEAKGILIKTYKSGLLKDWIRITTGDADTMNAFWAAFTACDAG